MDEHILVIKRSTLDLHEGKWQGLKRCSLDQFQLLVAQEKEFHPRSLMESNKNYKQIIPYLIFRHNNRYFVMQRSSSAGEQRLKNSYTLGIGGHVREEDLTGKSLIDWAQREFNEEVTYRGSFHVQSLGLLNDDLTEVGQVHLGCAFLLEGDSDAICIRSELKSGVLLPLEMLDELHYSFESWSTIIISALKEVTV